MPEIDINTKFITLIGTPLKQSFANMWICKRGADVTQYKIRNIEAYARAGYKQEYDIRFIRTMKINIPYRVL